MGALIRLLKLIYHFLKDIVYTIPYAVFLIDLYHIRNGRKKEDIALDKIGKKGFKVYDVSDLYNELKKHNHKICHIIGLGWSLLDSLFKIEENSFVIGMNYGALLDISFDLYFVEQGMCDEEETSLRKRFLNEVVINQASQIYYKNAWGYKDVNYVIENYADNVKFLRSFSVHCENPNNLNHFLKMFLLKDKVYFRQYKSTIISSIALAKNAGFKIIVIHGLDFGGPYFYEVSSINSKKQTFIPPKNSLSRGRKVHQTANSSTGVKSIMPLLRYLLENEGIELYSATESSPLSEILPVYLTNINAE